MTEKAKFRFQMEEDQGFVFHDEFPRCKGKLGDDDDIFDRIQWLDPASEAEKKNVIEQMEAWFTEDFR